MGAVSATEIMKSGAIVYYAALGESLPDETSIAAGADWAGNWTRIGYTGDPLVWTIEDERAVIKVEEELMDLDEHRIAFNSMLATTMAQITADHLALLLGGSVSTTAAGASQKGYDELDIDPTSLLTKYIIGFEGEHQIADGSTQPLRVFAEKATWKVNGDVEFTKKGDTYAKLPVIAKILKGTNYALRFQRVTAAATS